MRAPRSPHPVRWAGLLGAATGASAWATNGVLDRGAGAEGSVRLAMLPSVGEAALLIVASAALFAVIARWSSMHQRGPVAVDALLPSSALLLLVVPYLPWLPDAAPVLDVFAGPFKWLWWAVTLVLMGSVAGSRLGPDAAAPSARMSPHRRVVLVFVVSLLVYGAAAARLTQTPLFPGGDEPHYLVIAQSLWRDGDLLIENNHRNGDMEEYYATPLAPHYLTRGIDGEIYSVHPIGLPVIAAPIYALAGYPGVVASMVVLAAFAASIVWRGAAFLTGSAAAATFGWMAATLTAPFLFNSFTVYPEIPASAATASAYALATTGRSRWHRARWWACGTMIAVLPWLSTKYVFLAAALGVLALTRIWWPDRLPGVRHDAADPPSGPPRDRTRLRDTAGVIVPCILSLTGWFAFFWIVWGTPSPSAPYGPFRGTRLQHLPSGAPGLLFDQEYGVIVAAPVLWLGVSGLLAMMRDRTSRRTAIEVGTVCLGLLTLVGAFELWWGGSATVGRPVVAALPLLALPIAWQFTRRAGVPALRAAYLALLVASLVVAMALATVYDGSLLAAQRNGASRLLEWASPTWNAPAVLPTFITHPPTVALGFVAVWLVVATVGARLLQRLRRPGPGLAAAQALTAIAAGLVAGALTTSLLLSAWMRGPVRLEARATSRLLETFSPSRRPLAVQYTPFERADPERLPRSLQFVARAEDRRPRPPVALLHNARWSLPAGRYDLHLRAPSDRSTSNHAAGTLGLQLGRFGEPVQSWTVTPDAQGHWSTTFELPLHVGSVGFTADAGLEELSPVVTLRPALIHDAARFPPRDDVLQAVRYGNLLVFFNDDETQPEPGGFWTPGSRGARVSVTAMAADPPVLRVRAGPRATRLTVMTNRLNDARDLAADQTVAVPLPPSPVGVWAITARCTTSFVPALVDPRSRDRRELGCWVEF